MYRQGGILAQLIEERQQALIVVKNTDNESDTIRAKEISEDIADKTEDTSEPEKHGNSFP